MKGMTVQIQVETVTGYDAFGEPTVTTAFESVSDVLVGSPSSEEIVNSLQLYGKKITYVLGIPKGDSHNWTDATIVIPNPATGVSETYKTVGFPETGIQSNIPLRWGQNVKVERYGKES